MAAFATDDVGLAQGALSRADRIDAKVRLIRLLTRELPGRDPRSRLVRAALVRRDEILLDGVLALLSSDPPPPSAAG